MTKMLNVGFDFLLVVNKADFAILFIKPLKDIFFIKMVAAC